METTALTPKDFYYQHFLITLPNGEKVKPVRRDIDDAYFELWAKNELDKLFDKKKHKETFLHAVVFGEAKLLILIFCFITSITFAQTNKEKEVLGAINANVFPFKELTIDLELNEVATKFAKTFNDKTTDQNIADYFMERTINQKYKCYAVYSEVDYTGKEIIWFLKENYELFIYCLEDKDKVGIVATKNKLILIFPFDGSVYAEK